MDGAGALSAAWLGFLRVFVQRPSSGGPNGQSKTVAGVSEVAARQDSGTCGYPQAAKCVNSYTPGSGPVCSAAGSAASSGVSVGGGATSSGCGVGSVASFE